MAQSDTQFKPGHKMSQGHGRPTKKDSIREQLQFINGLNYKDYPKVPFSNAQGHAIRVHKACQSNDLSDEKACDLIFKLTDHVDGKPQQSVAIEGDLFSESFAAWVDDQEK
jgi:GTP cyclohydrolase II